MWKHEFSDFKRLACTVVPCTIDTFASLSLSLQDSRCYGGSLLQQNLFNQRSRGHSNLSLQQNLGQLIFKPAIFVAVTFLKSDLSVCKYIASTVVDSCINFWSRFLTWKLNSQLVVDPLQQCFIVAATILQADFLSRQVLLSKWFIFAE